MKEQTIYTVHHCVVFEIKLFCLIINCFFFNAGDYKFADSSDFFKTVSDMYSFTKHNTVGTPKKILGKHEEAIPIICITFLDQV